MELTGDKSQGVERFAGQEQPCQKRNISEQTASWEGGTESGDVARDSGNMVLSMNNYS